MSEDNKRAHQKVVRDSLVRKEHYRLYKAGKLWLIAGMTTASFALATMMGNRDDVHADEAAGAAQSTTTAVSSSATVTLSAGSSSADSSAASSASHGFQRCDQ